MLQKAPRPAAGASRAGLDDFRGERKSRLSYQNSHPTQEAKSRPRLALPQSAAIRERLGLAAAPAATSAAALPLSPDEVCRRVHAVLAAAYPETFCRRGKCRRGRLKLA